MRRLITTLFLGLLFVIAAVAFAAAMQTSSTAVPPQWAYGTVAPAAGGGGRGAGGAGGGGGGGGGGAGRGAAAPAADAQQSIPGSKSTFTLAQIRDGFGPADWFPEDHPQMPEIVAHGRREAMINACGLCHYPNGKGRPENSAVSGLPYAYIVQQMMDFKNDVRKSADSTKANTTRMAAFAKAMTDEEIKASATYFSSMKWTPWIRVVESADAPKTRIAGGMFVALEGADAGKEPLGNRIIEVPEKANDTEQLRNPRSGFVAYVPVGSIKKGETLVKTGGAGKTVQCAVCHGADLKGLGPVPGIAGRSPSYIARQLFDMQQSARRGQWSELMKATVSKLTEEDLVNISAYAASLAP